MNEPLLLLPGAMCDARLYLPAIVRFSQSRPVQVASLTQGETVTEMAEHALAAAPARFALVGLGLGGAVALEMLQRAPERIHRIALVSTDPLAETPPAAAARELRILAARAGRLDEAAAEDLPATALAPGPGRMQVAHLVRQMATALGAAVFTRQARAMQRRPDQQKTLRRMPHPALVLSGAHDGLVPERRQGFAAELMRNAEWERIEGAGHLVPLEQPEAFSRALVRWLARPSALA
ncbi:alpha/beta fold hydrolase [Alkalilacustris brevis]|uniref:alpha/beta fold hydrolase n=1 Tax=Alkalilacustris brevis TaxID=2026338 RepID=UPI000E0DF6E8|nr:alpha/beta hydrolase [Alkalilacustris brevis]